MRRGVFFEILNAYTYWESLWWNFAEITKKHGKNSCIIMSNNIRKGVIA